MKLKKLKEGDQLYCYKTVNDYPSEYYKGKYYRVNYIDGDFVSVNLDGEDSYSCDFLYNDEFYNIDNDPELCDYFCVSIKEIRKQKLEQINQR